MSLDNSCFIVQPGGQKQVNNNVNSFEMQLNEYQDKHKNKLANALRGPSVGFPNSVDNFIRSNIMVLTTTTGVVEVFARVRIFRN